MRKNLDENEHIIRIKIQNDRSTALGIAAEPLGLADTIPANTTWEYIGIIRSLNKDFAIEFDDKNYLTIWDDAQSGVFDENGGWTLIEYLPSH